MKALLVIIISAISFLAVGMFVGMAVDELERRGHGGED